jgi:CRISPR-associated protein Csb1
VEPLSSAAQFNSIWKSLEKDQREELEKEAKAKKTELSGKGFADAPAVFRKVSSNAAKQMTEFRDGSPNPERRCLGGVLAKGAIERNVTVNLVALRAISGSLAPADNKPEVTAEELRRYLLSLALLAGTADQDLFLREGCLLRYADEDTWHAVPRRGEEKKIDLASDAAKKALANYARTQAGSILKHWPATLEHRFDLKEAKKNIGKKDAGKEISAL